MTLTNIPTGLLPCTLLFLLLSCSSPADKKAVTADSTVISQRPINSDSFELPGFEVEVQLSAKAEEKLKKDKESVIVAAYVSATPKDSAANKEYLKYGELSISAVEKELKEGRNAAISGIRIRRSLYDSLVENSINVLINVYSGRRSTNVNLLDCGILQDSLKNLAGRKFFIQGKLIGE